MAVETLLILLLTETTAALEKRTEKDRTPREQALLDRAKQATATKERAQSEGRSL